ncbi:MAG: hypothetical protein MUF34_34990 [Polyangiaceae bacterium]|jgi:hypothetical protein|nr:hypothetical protein [Polyangiaceae bacterium]
MNRSFSAYDLVTLPRLSAPMALALGTELMTVFRLQVDPPASLQKAAGRLERALEALRSSRQLLLDAQALDATLPFAADLRLDAGWSAFYLFLQAWAKLPAAGPGAEGAKRAQHLITVVYPAGLSFTQAPYKIEWAESQMRLDRLGEPANAVHVQKLGGEAFVAELREAYEGYGEALQITTKRAEAKTVKVREPLDQVITSLRRYVLGVSAYGDHDYDLDDATSAEGAARALALTLLAPLAAWQSPGGRKGKADPIEAPPAGGDEPTTGGGGGEPGEAPATDRAPTTGGVPATDGAPFKDRPNNEASGA